MVKVTKVGQEPHDELHCPRGCGKLNNNRKLTNLKKYYKCNKCKGINLNIDEIKTMKLWMKAVKKNKLDRFLNEGKNGNLCCPTCTRLMKKISLEYDKNAADAGQKPGPGTMAAQGLLQPEMLIIVLPLLAIYGLSKALSKPKKKDDKLKTVTIDACRFCHSFWFDKGELKELAQVGQFADGSIELSDELKSDFIQNIKPSKPGILPTPGVVVTYSKSEVK
jgi:Zn-finger nucleic acid-binding protein